MNKHELEKNPHLTESVVHNLNRDPNMPFPDDSFDFITNSVSVDYLSKPKEVKESFEFTYNTTHV